MQQVTISAAKTNLSKLIDAATAGEEIVITKHGRAIAKLVAIRRRKFKIGILVGQLGIGPDFFEPRENTDLW